MPLRLITTGVIFVIITLAGCQPMTPESSIQNIMSTYSVDDVPGAALSVIVKGEKVFHKGFGLASAETGEAVTTATNFRLASVTKQFTAMSIMMLVESGRLQYETPIDEIFPDFPPYADRIRIQHLLQHTSGLIDYESVIPDTMTSQVHDRDVLQMMTNSVDSTYFDPGTEYQYSNSGYAVLAMIIEKLSGVSFPGFLKANIFDPLGMSNTVAFVDGKSVVPNRAYGHTIEDDSVFVTDQSRTSAVLGDGGIYSSIDDLFLWDQALYTNKLVSVETMERAFTPNLEIYGYGWRIDEFEGRKRYRHSGSTQGFRNFIMRLPDDSITVVLLTNRNSDAVRPVAEQVAKLFLD
jgi:CubicO group peptidase (beta-lactamase class C family)